jgi:hypothetical protein
VDPIVEVVDLGVRDGVAGDRLRPVRCDLACDGAGDKLELVLPATRHHHGPIGLQVLPGRVEVPVVQCGRDCSAHLRALALVRGEPDDGVRVGSAQDVERVARADCSKLRMVALEDERLPVLAQVGDGGLATSAIEASSTTIRARTGWPD